MPAEVYGIPPSFRDSGRHAVRAGATVPNMMQVLGERGSGTNVVRKLIETNTDLFRTEGLGWKHALPHMVAIPDTLLTLCVIRDARAWSLSMHDRPWHCDPALQSLDYARFIRSPWRGIVDRTSDFEEIHPEMQVQGCELQYDRHPLTGLPFADLFELRRVKLEGLLSMLNRGGHVALLRMETFLADPEGSLAWLAEQFGLAAPRSPLKTVRRRLGTRHSYSVSDHPATPKTLSDSDLAFLRSRLDLELEAQLGYDYGSD